MNKKAKRILLISWDVPPNTSGSATVIANLAQQFSKEEMLIIGEQPHRCDGWQWNTELPMIIHFPTAGPVNRLGRRLYFWLKPLVMIGCLFRMIHIALEYKCQAIVAVYPRWEYLLAGYWLACIISKPLFLYFHNTYLENMKGLERLIARRLQPAVFRKARHVFVISEGMAELFRDHYPELPCSALTHSFNDSLPVFRPLPPPTLPTRLTFMGSVNDSCRDALVRMTDAFESIEDVRLEFLTGTPLYALERLGLIRNSILWKSVPQKELIPTLRQADIVLLPHGFYGGYTEEEYKTIFPTKTIEYLICERPILAHTRPDCFLTRFLRQHDCALIVDKPDSSELIRAMNMLRTDMNLRNRLVANALKTAAMFRASVVVQQFRNRMDGIGENG